MRQRRQSGFTVIELMVTLTVAAVLVALAEALTIEIAHADWPLIHEIHEAMQAIGAANQVLCRIELSAFQNVPTFAVFPVHRIAVPVMRDPGAQLTRTTPPGMTETRKL